MNHNLFSELNNFIQKHCQFEISEERKEVLTPLIEFIQNKVNENSVIRLNFICTHNSRRSHFSQIWAQTMSFHFGVRHVTSYSGGTESTALFPQVAETLSSNGFVIEPLSESDNPIYSIHFSKNEHPIIGFSKEMDNNFNPSTDFAAIMTCDSANEACPFVPGAEKRIPITYTDPKEFDGSPIQTEKYLEKSIEIAREMHYVFAQIIPTK